MIKGSCIGMIIAIALSQSPWFAQPSPWLPITLSLLSICIAIAAFTVAFRNLYLSRYPHVRTRIETYHTNDKEYPNGETLFDVEVESYGLPIWDMRVVLQADYQEALPHIGMLKLEVEPVGSRPNPMNPGQVAKFRLTHSGVRELDLIVLTKVKRPCGISELPPDKVQLLIFGSGERLIKRIGRKEFDFGFNRFDELQNQKEIATH